MLSNSPSTGLLDEFFGGATAQPDGQLAQFFKGPAAPPTIPPPPVGQKLTFGLPGLGQRPVEDTGYAGSWLPYRTAFEGAAAAGNAISAPVMRLFGYGKEADDQQRALDLLKQYDRQADENSVFGKTVGPMAGNMAAGLTEGTLTEMAGGPLAMASSFGFNSGSSARVEYKDQQKALGRTDDDQIDREANLHGAAKASIAFLTTYIGGQYAKSLGGKSSVSLAGGMARAAEDAAEKSGLTQRGITALVGAGQNGIQTLLDRVEDWRSGADPNALQTMWKDAGVAAAQGLASGAAVEAFDVAHTKFGTFLQHIDTSAQGVLDANVHVETAQPEEVEAARTASPKKFYQLFADKIPTGADRKVYREAVQGELTNIAKSGPMPHDQAPGFEPDATAPTPLEQFNTPAPPETPINSAFKSVRDTLGAIKQQALGLPEFTPFKQSLNKWVADNQRLHQTVENFGIASKEAIPDEASRNGLKYAIQSGGDPTQLQAWIDGARPEYKADYEAAAKLSPAAQKVAAQISETNQTLLKQFRDLGGNIAEVPNYFTQIWTGKNKAFDGGSGSKLNTSVRYSMQKFHENYFAGEQAGLDPVRDSIATQQSYMATMGRAVNNRKFIRDMTGGLASDGRPLLATAGDVRVVDDPTATNKTYFVAPEQKPFDAGDYKANPDPSLSEWVRRSKDAQGNPIYVKGKLLVHPEIADHLANVLGDSKIRTSLVPNQFDSPITAGAKAVSRFILDDARKYAKSTLFGLPSLFHVARTSETAASVEANPFVGLATKIDLENNPWHQQLAEHGAMLAPDHVSEQTYMDGLASNSRYNLVNKALGLASNLPGLAGDAAARLKDINEKLAHYTFHQAVPGLKIGVIEKSYADLQQHYAKELSDGTVTQSQLLYASCQRGNELLGHLNYADMGANPTLQHLLQIFTLAPDFLQSNIKSTIGAVKGGANLALEPFGASEGRAYQTQFKSLAMATGMSWLMARFGNAMMNDGDMKHDHPFSVVWNNREYSIRSLPEDIYHAVNNLGGFARGRLSPFIGQGTLEAITGTNYSGQQVGSEQILKDMVAGSLPMQVQPLFKEAIGTDHGSVSPMEQALSSIGVKVARYSPVGPMMDRAHAWVKQYGSIYGVKPDDAEHPISPYRPLRYALEDGDFDGAAAEISKLRAANPLEAPITLYRRIHAALTHPLTGTIKTDMAFRSSLDARRQMDFDAARARQQLLVRRLGEALNRHYAAQRNQQPAPPMADNTNNDSAAEQ
jgi:hypothetical protein